MLIQTKDYGSGISIPSWLHITMLLALVWVEQSFAQQRVVEAKGDADVTFSLSNDMDVQRLRAVRNRAVIEATRVLEGLRRGEFSDDHDEPARAVEVLRLLRSADGRALRSLCDSLTLQSKIAEPAPLAGFLAANALIQIGGRPARTAVLNSLRRPLDRRTLLVSAHVLVAMDPAPVMCEHLRSAIAEQERREKLTVVVVDEDYRSNIHQLIKWLEDPKFLADPTNWP